MPGVGKVGFSIAGKGIILGPGSFTVKAEGQPVSVVGDIVAPHGKPPHTAATIVTGSPTVKAEGRPITVQGLSIASCAHPVIFGAPTVQSF